MGEYLDALLKMLLIGPGYLMERYVFGKTKVAPDTFQVIFSGFIFWAVLVAGVFVVAKIVGHIN